MNELIYECDDTSRATSRSGVGIAGALPTVPSLVFNLKFGMSCPIYLEQIPVVSCETLSLCGLKGFCMILQCHPSVISTVRCRSV